MPQFACKNLLVSNIYIYIYIYITALPRFTRFEARLTRRVSRKFIAERIQTYYLEMYSVSAFFYFDSVMSSLLNIVVRSPIGDRGNT